MSYIVDSKCRECNKEDRCVDLAVLMGGVSGIHGINGWSTKANQCVTKGHLGGGTITLNCINFEPQPAKPIPPMPPPKVEAESVSAVPQTMNTAETAFMI